MNDSKIVITSNFTRLTALMHGLGNKRDLQRTVSRTIKRTLTTVRKEGGKQLRSAKLIKLTASQAKLKVHAYDEANAGKAIEAQYGKIWIGSKAEPLGRFYARRVSAGRSKVVMKQDRFGGWNGVKLYRVLLNQYGAPALKDPKHSFLSMRKKGPVVFRRLGQKRLPIEKQFGPGLASLVKQTGIMRSLATVAQNRYRVEFDRNVKFYAEKAIARAMKAGK